MKKLLKCVDWNPDTGKYCGKARITGTCDGCDHAVNGWCQNTPVIMFASIFGDLEVGRRRE